MSATSDRLVWIDCEMTGLDLEVDELCEVAVFVTDFDLELVDADGFDLVIRPSDRALGQMTDVVRKMHRASGLLAEIERGTSLEEASAQVLAYVRRFVPLAGRAPLAGNTIGTDRAFLAKFMPEVEQHLHYRSIDVSTIKELSRHWFPRVYYQSPEKHGGHRASADILESIRELRYYRRAVFIPEPGPTSQELHDVADSVVGDFERYLA